MRRIRRETTIASRLMRGLGQGTGETYVSWLERRGVPSHGRSAHLPLFHRRRHFCTLSGHEYKTALLLGWDESVIDIMEQFPLLPVSRTQELAAERGIRHPMQKGFPLERTLDFLVDHAAHGPVGLSIKPSDGPDSNKQNTSFGLSIRAKRDRSSDREQELLELERAFCNERGWLWALVNEDQIPKVRATNLDVLNKRWTIELRGVAPERYEEIGVAIIRNMSRGHSLLEASKSVDRKLSLPSEGGAALAVAWYHLARKLWSANLDEPLDPRKTRPRAVPPENTSWVSSLMFYGEISGA